MQISRATNPRREALLGMKNTSCSGPQSLTAHTKATKTYVPWRKYSFIIIFPPFYADRLRLRVTCASEGRAIEFRFSSNPSHFVTNTKFQPHVFCLAVWRHLVSLQSSTGYVVTTFYSAYTLSTTFAGHVVWKLEVEEDGCDLDLSQEVSHLRSDWSEDLCIIQLRNYGKSKGV